MALIQWKQIDPNLESDGNLTGSLSISGSLFLNNQEITPGGISSIFSKTGSYHSTFNDLKVTGSLNIDISDSGDEFTVEKDGNFIFKVDRQGMIRLTENSTSPTPVEGAMMYSSSNEFYFGFR